MLHVSLKNIKLGIAMKYNYRNELLSFIGNQIKDNESLQNSINDLLVELKGKGKESKIHAEPKLPSNRKLLKNILLQLKLETVKDRYENNYFSTIFSGFEDLDRLIGEVQENDLILVGARAGMRKRVFINSIILHNAIHCKKSIGFFTMELSTINSSKQFISTLVEKNEFGESKFNRFDWTQYEDKLKALNDSKIYIYHKSTISFYELRKKARKLKLNQNVDMIFIDSLQQLSLYPMHTHYGNPYNTVESSIILRKLKKLAIELNIPILIGSQLSKAVDDREDRTPMISDLSLHSDFTNYVDTILLLYRPEYYRIESDVWGNSLKNLVEVIIGKHSKVGINSIYLKFNSDNFKFSTYEYCRDNEDSNETNEVPF